MSVMQDPRLLPFSFSRDFGVLAQAGEPDAISVWAFRQRPVFTFEGDKEPGDINGNQTGEFNGRRNGFRAFIVRDDFFDGAN